MAKRLPNKTPSEVKKIKASNDAYYKALSARDMRAMEKVWTCAADNMLIAPPANPRVYVGWSAIKRNWEAYWPRFAEYRVTMRVNKVNVSEPVAWVHGIETSHRRTKSDRQKRTFGSAVESVRNHRNILSIVIGRSRTRFPVA